MIDFIEQIANGDFSAILTVLTTLLSSGFGVGLTVIANKMLKYKKSVSEIAKEVENKIVPVVENVLDKAKVEIIEEVTKDFKILAESMALSLANTAESKIAIVENVSKIGLPKEVKQEIVKVIEKEVETKENNKKRLENTIHKLESNNIETL